MFDLMSARLTSLHPYIGIAGLLPPVFCLPGAALWTDRSGVMEKAALSRGECPLSAHTQLLI